MIVSGGGNDRLGAVLGILAVIFAMTNIVGGFLVTDRMLQMFRRDKGGDKK